ncbi:MAG: PD-(D/E)XK nuclease-like domain-containing protein [Thermoanaerobaculia bacterium]
MRVIDPKTRVLPPPGIYHGVPEVHYHGWKDAAGSSELRVLADKSPAHVAAGRRAAASGTERQIGKVDSKLFGSMVHDLVLRPEIFEQLYMARPAGNGNSNAFKDACARLLADNPFGFIVPQRDIDRAHGVKNALSEHELAGPAFFGRRTEVSLVWRKTVEIEVGGKTVEVTIPAKARLDAVDADVGPADLKVSSDVSEDAVARKVDEYRYDLQGAWYLGGASECAIETIPEFAFFFVEDDDPFDIQMYPVSGRVLSAAEARLDDLVPLWAKCQITGIWPKSPPMSKDLPLSYRLRNEVEGRVPFRGAA